MPSESQESFLYGFLLAIPQSAPPGKLAVTAKGGEAGGASQGTGKEESGEGKNDDGEVIDADFKMVDDDKK